MAASERAYTSEYSYIGQPYRPAQSYGQQGTYRAYPQPRPERPQVRRSEERPKLQVQPQVQQEMQPVTTHRMLLRVILLLVFAGAVLISTIWMSAKATEIKYEINKINKENVILQNEISMLGIKIESANSIEQIEDYATNNLKMRYPKSNQCIYVEEAAAASKGLASQIREKAYKE